MPEHQGPRRRAAVEVIVNGQRVTDRLHPYLISVQVVDTSEGDNDQCNIELDDRNAELQLPPDNVPLQVTMGWAGTGPHLPDRGRSSTGSDGRVIGQGELRTDLDAYEMQQPWGGPGMELVFSGTVSSVESGFGRKGGGRRVWIEATSGNVMGKAKEHKQKTWGEGNQDDAGSGSAGGGGTGGAGGAKGGGDDAGMIPLSQVMQDAFAGTGISTKLSPLMQQIKRKSWSMNQSPQDYAQSIARELGGVLKIAGGVAVLAMNGEDMGLGTVEAVWGVNLIGWRIKPYAGRPQYGQAASKYFDLHNAEWKNIFDSIGGSTPFGGTEAISHAINSVFDKNQAGQANAGTGRDSTSKRGTGWILMNGDPRAKATGHIDLVNARPGVDGNYQMTEVEHNYTRGVGYTTRANVKYPRLMQGDYGWKRDPGRFVEPPPGLPRVGDDAGRDVLPDGPPQIEFVPGGLPRVFGRALTPEQREAARQWYLRRGLEIPIQLL